MSVERELLQELLEWHKDKLATNTDFNFIMASVEAELAKPEKRPFAYLRGDEDDGYEFASKEDGFPVYLNPKQPLATFTVQDGKVIDYTLTNGELPNGDYEIYAKDEL